MVTAIFDLDGTVSDPAEGITGAINHALQELGRPTHRPRSLDRFVGPSLRDTFAELLEAHDEDDDVVAAIELYRVYYLEQGWRENVIYASIPEVLRGLRNSGVTLGMATLKGPTSAERILKHFQLRELFSDYVLGCRPRELKSQLLERLVAHPALAGSAFVMVGDRVGDFDAAKTAGMPSIAVEWGYGGPDEWELADARATRPEDLPALIQLTARPIA